MMSSSSFKTPLLTIIGTLLVLLLFLGGPHLYPTRSFAHLWNLGHIAGFWLWTYLALHYLKKTAEIPFFKLLGWILLSATLLSFLIEFLQSFISHRNFDLNDVVKNLLGAATATFFFAPSRERLSLKVQRCVKGILFVLLTIALIPFAKALTDETIARSQFPILSHFETPFEMSRWKGSANRLSTPEHVGSGKKAMKVTFSPAPYSTAFLKFFPGNWERWHSLKFNIYHPQTVPMKLVVRINDRAHFQNNQNYYDRFNRTIDISPGWQTITIPISQIKKAPRKRDMDMTRIEAFGIFMVKPKQNHTIYLDDIKLVSDEKK